MLKEFFKTRSNKDLKYLIFIPLITYYAPIGLIISYVLNLNEETYIRRILQGTALVIGCLIYFSILRKNLSEKINNNKIKFLAAAILTISSFYFFRSVIENSFNQINPKSIIDLILAAWLCSMPILAIIDIKTFKLTQIISKKQNPFDNLETCLFKTGLIITGICIFLVILFKSYKQPEDNLFLSMSGNTTFLGCFLLYIFILINFKSTNLQFILSTPWLILSFYTTSRLVLVLFVLWLCLEAFCLLKDFNNELKYKSHFKNIMGSLVVSGIYFSFLISGKIGPFEVPKQNYDEIVSRYARIARPFGLSKIFDTHNAPESIKNTTSIKEDRYELYKKALLFIYNNPHGNWPNGWEAETKVFYTNKTIQRYKYSYPHNILLEIAIKFGILPGILLSCGLASCIIKITKVLHNNNSLYNYMLFMALIFEIIRAFVSGSLIDNISLCFLVPLTCFTEQKSKK